MADIKYARFRGASIEKVIRLEINEGGGTDEDHMTKVVYWLTMDGKILGHNDPEDREFRGGEK